jgi:hypothetical protein
MNSTPRDSRLPIEWDTRHCNLSAGVRGKLEEGLEAVGRLVRDFPVSNLHILVEQFQRTSTWHVKTTLQLPAEALVSLGEGEALNATFEGCIAKLIQNVHAYKDRMSRVAETAREVKGTRQDLEPTLSPDAPALERAVADGDYGAFRSVLLGYEEPLRKRIGRWVERYPEVNARIDHGLKIADLVEAVFLDAFEQYEHRPRGVRFGDWLEHLIDPAIKEMIAHPEQELENINLARSALGARESL